MNATDTSDPWVVFDYEADMFFGLCELLSEGNPAYVTLPHRVQNAVVESALLHARQLVDVLLSRGKDSDDINLSALLPGFEPPRLAELRRSYGNRGSKGSICWTLNKRLAHPTAHRGSGYDYSTLINQLRTLLVDLIQEVKDRRGRRL